MREPPSVAVSAASTDTLYWSMDALVASQSVGEDAMAVDNCGDAISIFVIILAAPQKIKKFDKLREPKIENILSEGSVTQDSARRI